LHQIYITVMDRTCMLANYTNLIACKDTN